MSEDHDDTILVPLRPLAVPEPAEPDEEHTLIVPRVGERIVVAAAPLCRDARPGHYAFRISRGGEAIPLDAPCYIGRRPTPPRVPSRVPPRLVRVPSPLKEVSSTHLEVKQVGSSVIVTDLRSTNGSIVMVPGSVPRRLRQGESVVVSPGTLIDIGDENILQILPVQRPD